MNNLHIWQWLLFGVVPTGDMLQKKIDDLLHSIPTIFAIADDILFAGCDELGRPQCNIRQGVKNMQTD